MNEDTDDIMNIYGSKCSHINIPNPEQEFQEKCRNEGQGLVEKYFSRTPSKEQKPSQQYVPQEQPQQHVLNEAQQRNMTLNEAAISIAKAIPMFTEKRDREYLKEIREAIEDMMS
jgi:hypothetical protein